MLKEISVRRLSVGTIYKIVAIGFFMSFVPCFTLMGIFALFGAHTVRWNGAAITGIWGLVSSPFLGFLVSALFTVILGSACAFGLLLYSRFASLRLRFVAPVGQASGSGNEEERAADAVTTG